MKKQSPLFEDTVTFQKVDRGWDDIIPTPTKQYIDSKLYDLEIRMIERQEEFLKELAKQIKQD